MKQDKYSFRIDHDDVERIRNLKKSDDLPGQMRAALKRILNKAGV